MKRLWVFLVLTMFVSTLLPGCGSGDRDNPPLAADAGESKSLEDYMKDGFFGIDTTKLFEDTQPLEVDTESNFATQTQTLNAQNSVFEHQGVRIAVDGVFLDDDLSIEVTKMKAPSPLADAVVNAYRFTPAAAGYSGLYSITIPYDGAAETVGAGYFNKSTNSWEPVAYEIDEANSQIVITTHHLSTYGAFSVVGEGTRTARIQSNLFEAHNHMSRHGGGMYAEIIQESLSNEMTPGGKAYDLGAEVVGDWFTGVGVITEFEGVLYSSEYISNLSDIFGNIGLGLSIAQLAVDYSRGDQQAMAVNTFNTAQGLSIGKWGTKALKVSMIGVTAIDYSLNKLIEQVIGGREEVWFKAYDRYYNERQRRTGEEWYHIIKGLHDHAASPEQFQRLLDTELNMFTYRFWNEPEDVQAEYQVEIQGHAWTGGGGLNEELKTRIADSYKSILLRDTLEPVFRRIEREVRYEQFVEYQNELAKARDELNRIVTFEVQEVARDDEELNYAGYILQLGPLADTADDRQWTGRLNNDGHVRTRFTVMGHITSGAPDEIRLYKNMQDFENDKPAYTQKIKIDVPDTRIVIGEVEDVDLTGTWEGYTVITHSVFADMKIDSSQSGSDEAEDFLEGCEEEFGQAMMLMVQEIIKMIMHKDIPTTIEFVAGEQEDRYTGYIHIRPEEVLPPDEDGEIGIEGSRDPFTAVYEDGRVTITVQEDDYIIIYNGTLQNEDHITGTFSIGEGQYDLMSGNWRATRVETD